MGDFAIPPVQVFRLSHLDGFQITVLQCSVKFTTPRCCIAGFFIRQKINPTNSSTIIFKSVVIHFVGIAVKNHQQIIGSFLFTRDHRKLRDCAAIHRLMNKSAGSGCSGHVVVVFDSFNIQDFGGENQRVCQRFDWHTSSILYIIVRKDNLPTNHNSSEYSRAH